MSTYDTDGPEAPKPRPEESPSDNAPVAQEAPDLGTGPGTEYTDGPEPPQDR